MEVDDSACGSDVNFLVKRAIFSPYKVASRVASLVCASVRIGLVVSNIDSRALTGEEDGMRILIGSDLDQACKKHFIWVSVWMGLTSCSLSLSDK